MSRTCIRRRIFNLVTFFRIRNRMVTLRIIHLYRGFEIYHLLVENLIRNTETMLEIVNTILRHFENISDLPYPCIRPLLLFIIQRIRENHHPDIIRLIHILSLSQRCRVF